MRIVKDFKDFKVGGTEELVAHSGRVDVSCILFYIIITMKRAVGLNYKMPCIIHYIQVEYLQNN